MISQEMAKASQTAIERHMVLDPRTLGRPVHLLPVFAQRLGADLGDYIAQSLNRRYGASFDLSQVKIARDQPGASPERWKTYKVGAGHMGVLMERELVLQVLNYRYGLMGQQADRAQETPFTTTEARLAQSLGLQLTRRVLHRIECGLSGIDADHAVAVTEGRIAWCGESHVPPGEWFISARVSDMRSGLQTVLRFALDSHWMDCLLDNLAVRRSHHCETPLDDKRPLSRRMQVRLEAQLLRQSVTLGELFDLRVDSVIPVSLKETHVMVKEEQLFTATVAEHKGKLWLTAFNDAI